MSYTTDSIISAAIAENYVDYIRIAREELVNGKKEVSLLILRCAYQMIMAYLENMKHSDVQSHHVTVH